MISDVEPVLNYPFKYARSIGLLLTSTGINCHNATNSSENDNSVVNYKTFSVLLPSLLNMRVL